VAVDNGCNGCRVKRSGEMGVVRAADTEETGEVSFVFLVKIFFQKDCFGSATGTGARGGVNVIVGADVDTGAVVFGNARGAATAAGDCIAAGDAREVLAVLNNGGVENGLVGAVFTGMEDDWLENEVEDGEAGARGKEGLV
jgi:hypothetical protein